MKTITILILALTLISCEKDEPIKQAATTQAATEHPKDFDFVSHGLGDTRMHLYQGATLISPSQNTRSECVPVTHTLEPNVNYRLVVVMAGGFNDFTQVACEYSMVYKNGELTTVKSNGNYNLFFANDCGFDAWTIK